MGFDGLTNLLPAAAIPSISNAIYGPGWDGVPSTSPSKNVLYDKISFAESLTSVTPNSYTPVQSNVTNANTFTWNPSTYWRFGNTVYVCGWMKCSLPAGGSAAFDVSLPIASNFTAVWQLAGVGANGTMAPSFGVHISANITTNSALFFLRPPTSGATNTNSYVFQYLVL